jgi:serine/threonine protein kinase
VALELSACVSALARRRKAARALRENPLAVVQDDGRIGSAVRGSVGSGVSEEAVPTAIDRYEILRKLAVGGMAELFLAKQSGLEGFEKVVVIKRILSHLAQDEEFVSMFLDEARIAAKLGHPNIVQIYDLGKADDSYYIAMEYVSGRNVQHIITKQKEKGGLVPVEHTCRMVAGVCDGLHYAHSRKDYDGQPLNIVHRDISPQNILVSFAGGVKVVDFGIAKASTQLAQTRAGVLKGKYAYMSPEQVRGQKVDHRSDIFALGLVMYEMLTGRRPFDRESSLKTLKAIVQDKPLNPREINPDIPMDVVKLLSRALEKSPDRRYKNAQEMQLALEDYLESSPQKSNNVRLSRYLYDLFDDELNSDSATMVVQGIGEVIIPTGDSRAKREPSVEEEIDAKTLSAVLAPTPGAGRRPGGESAQNEGPSTRRGVSEPGVRVVRDDREVSTLDSAEDPFEGTNVNSGPPAYMQGGQNLDPAGLPDSEEDEQEDRTVPVYDIEEFERQRGSRGRELQGARDDEDLSAEDRTVGGLLPAGISPRKRDEGGERNRAAAMLAKVEAMAAGFEEAVSNPAAQKIPPQSVALRGGSNPKREWETSTQQGPPNALQGSLHSDEAVVGPDGVVTTRGASAGVRPAASASDTHALASPRPVPGSGARHELTPPRALASPVQSRGAQGPKLVTETTPETSRRPVLSSRAALTTSVIIALAAIGLLLVLTVGAVVLLFVLDGTSKQGVGQGLPRLLHLDTTPSGIELRFKGVSYRTPAPLIVEQGTSVTVEIIRAGKASSFVIQVPLGADPAKKTISLVE